jgi:hypothetical protein
MQQAGQAMQQLAQSMPKNSPLSQSMQQAAKALQSGNPQQARQALQKLQQNLQACQLQQQNLQSVNQGLNQIATMKQCLGSPGLAKLPPQPGSQGGGQTSGPSGGQKTGPGGGKQSGQGTPGAPSGQSGARQPGPDGGGKGAFHDMSPSDEATRSLPLYIRTRLQKGEVIGLLSFRTEPTSAEQTRELQSVIESAAPGRSAESIDQQALPRSHREMIRKYFDSLGKGRRE